MTASIYLSRYNDKYYGQWVLMHVPFRNLDDLWRKELELVPDHLWYQTLALLHRPEHWRNPAAVREELELEAFREHHVRNILAMLAANHELIGKYLDGTLDKNEVVAPEEIQGRSQIPLAPDQQRITDEIVQSVRDGRAQKQNREEAWKGDVAAEEPSPFPKKIQRSTFAVLGPAGSGKTTCVQTAIDKVADEGGRVLVLVFKPIQETLELMLPYDFIIIEEVGQLSQALFERIMQLWEAADQLPTIVFVGDFWQLPGVEPTKAKDSPLWHSGRVQKRELHTMHRCKCKDLQR